MAKPHPYGDRQHWTFNYFNTADRTEFLAKIKTDVYKGQDGDEIIEMNTGTRFRWQMAYDSKPAQWVGVNCVMQLCSTSANITLNRFVNFAAGNKIVAQNAAAGGPVKGIALQGVLTAVPAPVYVLMSGLWFVESSGSPAENVLLMSNNAGQAVAWVTSNHYVGYGIDNSKTIGATPYAMIQLGQPVLTP